VNVLVARPGGGVVAAEELDRVVPVPRLLEELPRGACERVLSVHVEQAGWDLRQHLPHGRPQLANEKDVAGRRDRQDGSGVVGPQDLVVPDPLPRLTSTARKRPENLDALRRARARRRPS
jgi:hypothetical protein